MMQRILYKPDYSSELNSIIKMEYGRAAFIEESLRKDDNQYYSIGCAIPKEIENIKESSYRIRFISLRDIDVACVSTMEGGKILHYPPRETIIQKAKLKENYLISEAERSLLSCVNTQIVRTTNVRQGLNPIVEIINGLLELDEIPIRMLSKQKRYIPLLRDLGYIKVRKESIIPSNEFTKFQLNRNSVITKDESFYAMLGEIAVRGYPYIKTTMKVMHLTPILRTSNVIYFSSLLNEERLPLRTQDIFTLYKNYYGSKAFKGDIKTLGYIRELTDVDIIEKEDNFLIPSSNYWTAFFSSAPTIT